MNADKNSDNRNVMQILRKKVERDCHFVFEDTEDELKHFSGDAGNSASLDKHSVETRGKKQRVPCDEAGVLDMNTSTLDTYFDNCFRHCHTLLRPL